MEYEIYLNRQKNGYELFACKDLSSEFVAELSANGFRWNRKGKYFYAPQTAETQAYLTSQLTTGTACIMSRKNASKADLLKELEHISNAPDEYIRANLIRLIKHYTA
ncbi:MAG: hypothetical protein MJ196_11650 [Treponemataceae bacterium]|nr:hypothetical protein [Treponemataceae bacterium]